MQYIDSLRSQNISINCKEYSKVSILEFWKFIHVKEKKKV